ARQLLTLRGSSGPRRGAALGDLGLIQDGSLLIRDGELVEVGPTRRVENLAEARQALEINAAGRVVMPGFVDSHTHLAFPPPGAAGLDAEAAAREIRATNGQRLGEACARLSPSHGAARDHHRGSEDRVRSLRESRDQSTAGAFGVDTGS